MIQVGQLVFSEHGLDVVVDKRAGLFVYVVYDDMSNELFCSHYESEALRVAKVEAGKVAKQGV